MKLSLSLPPSSTLVLPEIGAVAAMEDVVKKRTAWNDANKSAPDFIERAKAIEDAWQEYINGIPTAKERDEAADRILTGKMLAKRDQEYLSPALYSLRFVAVPKLPAPAATDTKWRVYYSPRWINMFTVEEVRFIVLHELGHCLRMHSRRANAVSGAKLNNELWNIAGDLEINDDEMASARRRGMPTLDYYAVFPYKFKDPDGTPFPDGLTAEEYFEKLKAIATEVVIPVPGMGMDGNCGTCNGQHNSDIIPQGVADDPGTDPGMTPNDVERVKHEVAKATLEAAKAGRIPRGMERWAKELYNPRIRWRSWLPAMIRKVVQESTSNPQNYTYGRPNRKQQLYAPYFMPSMIGYKPRLAFLQDTSGSMSTAQINMCMTEIMGALRQLNGEIYFVAADAQAYEVQKLRRIDDAKVLGGGGTQMDVAIETVVAKIGDKIDAIICMTDCETPWPLEKPPCPLIIVRVGQYGRLPDWPHKVIEIDPSDIK